LITLHLHDIAESAEKVVRKAPARSARMRVDQRADQALTETQLKFGRTT